MAGPGGLVSEDFAYPYLYLEASSAHSVALRTGWANELQHALLVSDVWGGVTRDLLQGGSRENTLTPSSPPTHHRFSVSFSWGQVSAPQSLVDSSCKRVGD